MSARYAFNRGYSKKSGEADFIQAAAVRLIRSEKGACLCVSRLSEMIWELHQLQRDEKRWVYRSRAHIEGKLRRNERLMRMMKFKREIEVYPELFTLESM